MNDSYDVLVLGLGAMGSAALYHLARRQQKCAGIERFNIPHEFGSSHGITRIIRLAYSEHPSYIPLLRRAYQLWRQLEEESQARLLHVTGSIDAGPADSSVFRGSLESCLIHSLKHEVLTSQELTRRFPGYRLPADSMAVFQQDGGFLAPEACISAHIMRAQELGAAVYARERVVGWEPTTDGVEVRTDRARYRAKRLIVSAGAWVSEFVPQLRDRAVPERQVLAWLAPLKPAWFRPETFPVFNVAVEEGRYYGLPAFGIPGFKLGRWRHLGQRVDPDNMDRECNAEDEEILRAFAGRYFPDGAGNTLSMRSCIFTMTADEHFVLDLMPGYPQVVIASPCSGHGFKFASVTGEILADLAVTGTTAHDISLLRLNRLL